MDEPNFVPGDQTAFIQSVGEFVGGKVFHRCGRFVFACLSPSFDDLPVGNVRKKIFFGIKKYAPCFFFRRVFIADRPRFLCSTGCIRSERCVVDNRGIVLRIDPDRSSPFVLPGIDLFGMFEKDFEGPEFDLFLVVVYIAVAEIFYYSDRRFVAFRFYFKMAAFPGPYSRVLIKIELRHNSGFGSFIFQYPFDTVFLTFVQIGLPARCDRRPAKTVGF